MTSGPAQATENPSTWTFVTIFVACVLIGLLLARTHVFVVISSDRHGQSLITGQVLKPGDTVSGNLTLSNDGLLPFVYSVHVQNADSGKFPSGLRLQVRRLVDAHVLHDAPLDGVETAALGTLAPGEKVRLSVSIALSRSSPVGAQVNLAFIWTAKAIVIPYWPWVVLLALALLGTWVTILWLRKLRRRQPGSSVDAEPRPEPQPGSTAGRNTATRSALAESNQPAR